MKLTAILMIVGCLQVSANGFAQGKITMKKANATLEEVLVEINKQTGVLYSANNETLKKAGLININVRDEDLKEVLRVCFEGQPLTYLMRDNIIIVKEKVPPVKVTIVDERTPIDVRGKVTDEKGNPIAGVTVMIKGTNKQTLTDENGEFSLASIDREAVLIFSSINMEMFEIKVNGQVELAVKLKAKVREMSEVVVSTGYQNIPKERATGSFVTVSKAKLDQRIAVDIISKLEGITNGLVFNKDPNTGKNKLRVRGESTLFGYTEPLVVVDNFPYYGNINEINPNDVENVTILKDAAAASIWGARAGNGVIVITTKRGKPNQHLSVEFNANTTIAEKPDIFYSPVINPSDFIDLEIFLFGKGKYTSDLNDINKKAVSPIVEILNNRARGLITSADSVTQIDALRTNDWRNDYLKHIYQNSILQQYQMNISGGSSNASYYLSAGYDKSRQEVIGNESNRITINSNTSFKPTKNLELQFNLGYSENNNINNGTAIVPNIYPYMRLVDDEGNSLSIPQHRSVWEDTIANHGFLDWKYDPLKERKYIDARSKTYITRLSTGIKYNLFKGFTANIYYQYYRSSTRAKDYRSRDSYVIRDNMNKFGIINNGNYTGTNFPNGGILNLSTNDIIAHNGRFLLNYNKQWSNNEVSAIAGIDVSETRSEANSSRYYGYDDATGSFVNPNLFTIYSLYPSGNGIIGDPGLSYAGTINRFRSYFMNSSYTYKSKYVISSSIRLDQANIFGVNTNQKGKPLWSIGSKWFLSKEEFYGLSNLFPELSLGITYGYQGNVSPDAVAVVTLAYAGNTTYTGLPYATISNVPNPELKWEKLGQLNIGLDFATQNERISGRIEYFQKNGVDLLGQNIIDPTTGVSNVLVNYADMRSKGIDIGLTTRNVNKAIQWSTAFIFNYAAEKVTRYNPAFVTAQYLNAFRNSDVVPIAGYPLQSVFSYRWGGLDPTTGDPRIILSDTINKNYTLANANSINPSDLVFNGRYNPPYTGSIANTFSWKGLSLTFNIVYKLGYYFRRGSISYNSLINVGWQQAHSDIAYRWQKPGDEEITNVPSFVYPDNSTGRRDSYYTNSDILIERGDHIRMQFVNLNYSIDKNSLKKLKLQNLSLFFYVNNLNIIIWKANNRGIDPDYPYLNYPPARTYTLGFRTTL